MQPAPSNTPGDCPLSAVGSPGKARDRLEALLAETGAGELMLTARKRPRGAARSVELAADVFGEINEARHPNEAPHTRGGCGRTSTEQGP
jgi:alkanesulfonate monooxygenase SsuD/methylene tetrahydromethanopterin reductase-like flavin-dependent oxidoreductase (luciferase family)